MQDHALLTESRALRTTVGSNAMMAGVAQASEAVLTGRANALQAQQQLHDYVVNVLGAEMVEQQLAKTLPLPAALATEVEKN